MALLLSACQTDSFISESEKDPIKFGTKDSMEIWRQVALRFPATGEVLPVSKENAIEIQLAGEELLFISKEGNCPGRISEDGISLTDCYYQSPYWNIVERKNDTLYIYPRLGAMYYYDYVMKKVTGYCEVKCDLIPSAGLCEAAITKYYFNKAKGKCEVFYWGGCFGVVPFETLEECESCKCSQME